MTNKENKLNLLDNQINALSDEIEALRVARRYTEAEHINAVEMVENVPNNIYINEWKSEAEHLEKVLQRLDNLYKRLATEQSRLCAKFEAIEQGKAEAEKVALMLDPITARHLADLLGYQYNQLERAEQQDPFKDNGYLKEAINNYLTAYEKTLKGA